MLHHHLAARRLAVSLALGALLSACPSTPPCTGSCDDGGASDSGTTLDGGAHDAGAMDAGDADAGADDAGTTMDAGQPDAGDTDAGTVALLLDYVPCTLDIECPSGLGRCQKLLPLHHPDPGGNTAVPASTVFTSLQPGQGICTETCELDPDTCATSSYLNHGVSYTCQLVYEALSPYGSAGALDAGAMAAGIAFAAVCRPPLVAAENCGPCGTDADCGAGTCWDLAAGAPFSGTGTGGACVMPCGASDACPAGFACSNQRCLPLKPTCTACADLDGDGRGVGFCGLPDLSGHATVSAVDCDDADPTSYWHATLQCGPVDHDCNGFTDATDMVGTDAYGAEHCAACNDACPAPGNTTVAGVTWACLGPVGARSCTSTCLPGLLDCDATPGCEVGPTTPGHQFAPDQDLDGYACNPAPGSSTCVVQTACTLPPGYAPARDASPDVSSCSVATCPDADEGHATVHPLAPELCDGLDNDQNGVVDDGFLTPGATICTDGTLPPCTGSAMVMPVQVGASCTATCGMTTGAGTWACNGTGGVVCQPSTSAPEIACNGIDDDCNGVTDEPAGEGCSVADAPPGTMDSPCWQHAVKTCVGGAIACVPAATSLHVNDVDVPGDGFDTDCDGTDLQHDAVYVYSNYSGATTSTGSRAAPFVKLEDALVELDTHASAHPTKTLYLQDAASIPVLLRNRALTLGTGRRVYGGFSGGLTWTPPSATNPTKTRVCVPPSSVPLTYTAPGGIVRAAWVGVQCFISTDPSQPTVLRNVSVEVNKTGCGVNLDTPALPPAADPRFGISTYGAIFKDCDEVELRNVAVSAFTPPAPATPGTRTGVNGNDGNVTPRSTAGGAGGHGGIIAGLNGSTAAPTAAPNMLGGTGGGQSTNGSAPTSGGNRGNGGAASSYVALLLAASPAMSQRSYSLLSNGYVVFATYAQYLGGDGGNGAWGAGGGGAGGNVLFGWSGGNGGQGGGAGPGGIGGGAGGDTIGLVLLGTQLPGACTSTSSGACGAGVTIAANAGGPGGAGGTGGTGGNGGLGSTGSPLPYSGGNGGKGCGGGGGAGGRGGLGLGVVGDLQSLTASNVVPPWLTVSTPAGGAGGTGGATGVDGTDSGSFACGNSSVASATGRAGVGYANVVLPHASCAAAINADTDFPAGSAQWVIAGEVAASKTCP